MVESQYGTHHTGGPGGYWRAPGGPGDLGGKMVLNPITNEINVLGGTHTDRKDANRAER